MKILTPTPVGEVPSNVGRHHDGPPFGRISLSLSEADHAWFNQLPAGPSDESIEVLDLVSLERFRIRRADCGFGCFCAAEATWVPTSGTCGFCDRPIAGEPVELLDAMPGEPTIACQPCYATQVMQAPPDPGPGSPCPYCDEASIVDEGGACVHCGVRRVEVAR